jgi:Fe-S-cluster containining protein
VTAGCAGCGSCCAPVVISFDQWARIGESVRALDPAQIHPDSAERWYEQVFITAHMRPVGAENGKVFLECGFYDREHRACRAYDQRPAMCRNYPWYGAEPDAVTAMANMWISDAAPCCSYVADLPPSDRPPGARPLIPLTVL